MRLVLAVIALLLAVTAFARDGAAQAHATRAQAQPAAWSGTQACVARSADAGHATPAWTGGGPGAQLQPDHDDRAEALVADAAPPCPPLAARHAPPASAAPLAAPPWLRGLMRPPRPTTA